MGTPWSGKAQIHTNGTSPAHPMLHHYIVSCTPNLRSWGPSFNFSAPVWIPVSTAGEWWLRSTKYNAKYSPRRKQLQEYKNSLRQEEKKESTQSLLRNLSAISAILSAAALILARTSALANWNSNIALALSIWHWKNWNAEMLGKVLKYVLKCCGPCLYTDPPSYTMY